MYPRVFITLAAVLLLTSLAHARTSVNKSIRIDDGETVSGDLASVNGSVTVGTGADLQGSTESVNGGISIGADSKTRDVSSVNGSVKVDDRVTVDGDLGTVNGTLRAGDQTQVTGNVETVNGSIDLRGAIVQRDVRTVNGRVVLASGSRVRGNIIVEHVNNYRSHNDRRRPLEIELRDGSVVEGDIRIEDGDRKVRVTLSGGSEVQGQIHGAEVIRE